MCGSMLPYCGTRGTLPPQPPEITVYDCEDSEWDYIVTLERPDGVRIKVLIPKKDGEHEDNCVSNPARGPFGLNLVGQGHYI